MRSEAKEAKRTSPCFPQEMLISTDNDINIRKYATKVKQGEMKCQYQIYVYE